MSIPTKELIRKQAIANILIDIKAVFLSDKRFDYKLFVSEKGHAPNLDNPQTFSEKLLYLKQHYRNPLQQLCSDKLKVNDYLRECGCEDIIREPLAVYKSVEEIDLDKLPDKFFIKCNHMSGCNFVFDKNNPNASNILKMLKVCMRHDWYKNQREWNYKGIERRIICEKLLVDSKGNMPVDYKFYCFSGEPKYFMISYGEYEHQVRNHKFDMGKNSIDHYFKETSTLKFDEANLPDDIDVMIEYVKKLCKPFPHVRVDLYNVAGKIYFGELTFYSNGGMVSVCDPDFDKEIGSWIDLSKYTGDLI